MHKKYSPRKLKAGIFASVEPLTSQAGSILAGMMTDERYGSALETAVECGAYSQLTRMIRSSPLFKESYAMLDPADEEQVEKYIDCLEDYIIPLSECILQMSGSTIKRGMEKVEKARSNARYDSLEKASVSLYKAAYAEAEQAKKNGTQPPEQAVERAGGRRAVRGLRHTQPRP